MHRQIRLLAVALLTFSFASAVHAQSASGGNFPLPEKYFPTLQTLIDSASKQSPRMVARNTENAVAEANRISARAGQLPAAGGYASYYPWVTENRAVAGSTPGGGSLPDAVLHPKKLSYSFSITQPIFHWGALANSTKIGELGQKITEGQSADVYRLLVDEIRGQFLQVVTLKAGLARARFNQKIADDQLTLARSKLEKHVISEADMFTPTMTAEQARLASDRVADEYENSKIYLGKLCGTAPLTDDQIPNDIPPVTPASSAIQSVVAEFTGEPELKTYSMQVMRDQIETERLNYKVANTRLRPKVNLALGTSQDEFSYSVNIADKYKVRQYFAGVIVNWTLFDGFQTRSAKTVSLARRRQLEQTYKDQTADTIAAINSQVRQLEFSARNLAIVERLLGSANDILTLKKEDMARGVSSDVEVNAAQLGLYDSQIAAYTARNEYMMRVSRLLSATLKDPALVNIPVTRR
ncbi:MAG: TolC family protein [Opitutus sp.]